MTKLLSESKWKFTETQIPDKEREACLYYEYGREADHFKKRVAAWRERNPELMRVARELLSVDLSMLDKAAPFIAQPPALDAIPRDENEAAVWKLSITVRLWFSQVFPFQNRGLSELANPDDAWNNHHAFLYRFPPFPDTPWLELDKSARENALRFFWKARQLNKSPDMSEAVKRQKEIQALAKIPLDEKALKAVVSEHMDFFVSAQALREGVLLNGKLPPGSRLEKENTQLWMEDYCHEQVQFVVNWAKSPNQIVNDFKEWLGRRRPHDKFEPWKGATPLELLKKLGAYRILKQPGMTADKACGSDRNTRTTAYGLYESPDAYLRAKREAKTALDSMFPPTTIEIISHLP